MRCTQRLAEAGAVASVGWTSGDYDKALAAAFDSPFKAELACDKGPWAGIDDLEIATAEHIDWFNHRRLHGEMGTIPPVEYEHNYDAQNLSTETVESSVGASTESGTRHPEQHGHG